MSQLVVSAFRALGPAPSARELELVAKALRKSGDSDLLAMFAAAADGVGRSDDHEAYDAVVALADTAGAGPFTALDLIAEMSNPGSHTRALNRPRP
jgi:hypothetical protein